MKSINVQREILAQVRTLRQAHKQPWGVILGKDARDAIKSAIHLDGTLGVPDPDKSDEQHTTVLVLHVEPSQSPAEIRVRALGEC